MKGKIVKFQKIEIPELILSNIIKQFPHNELNQHPLRQNATQKLTKQPLSTI